MRIHSFLALLDLGFGVFLMTAIFSVSGTYSFLINLFNWREASNKISLVIILLSTMSMVCIWAYASNGVYKNEKTQKIISSALYQWSVFMILWIILLLLSTNSNSKTYVCLKGNCPESFWLYNNTWNDEVSSDTYEGRIDLFNDKTKIARVKIMSTVVVPTESPDLLTAQTKYNNEPIISLSRNAVQDKININMIIIFSNVMFYLSIFTYGWMVLYSYNIELKLKPLCDDKETNLKNDRFEMV